MIRQCQGQVLAWRRVEELRKGPVDGLTLEYEFRRIAARGGDDFDKFHGIANLWGQDFTAEQRVELFRLFSRVGEHDKFELTLGGPNWRTEAGPLDDEFVFGFPQPTS